MIKGVSVTVITYNEEYNIRACLSRLRAFEDVVVVDAESDDRTRDIAASFPNVRIFTHKWESFGAQRDYAESQAQYDWVFVVDADERPSNTLVDSIRDLIKGGHIDDYDAYTIHIRDYMWGKLIHFGNWGSKKIRLFHRKRTHRQKHHLHADHDHYIAPGRRGSIAGELIHYSHMTVRHTLDKFATYTDEEARLLLTSHPNRTILFSIMSMIYLSTRHFVVKYFLRGGFLEGWRGLLMASMRSYYVILSYLKYFELRSHKKELDSHKD